MPDTTDGETGHARANRVIEPMFGDGARADHRACDKAHRANAEGDAEHDFIEPIDALKDKGGGGDESKQARIAQRQKRRIGAIGFVAQNNFVGFENSRQREMVAVAVLVGLGHAQPGDQGEHNAARRHGQKDRPPAKGHLQDPAENGGDNGCDPHNRAHHGHFPARAWPMIEVADDGSGENDGTGRAKSLEGAGENQHFDAGRGRAGQGRDNEEAEGCDQDGFAAQRVRNRPVNDLTH